jgi:hypothetical protein
MRNINEDMIEVSLNRLGTPEVTVELLEDATIQDALDKAGWSLNPGEKCYVDSIPGTPESVLDDGDTIQIVSNKVGGLK